MKRRDLFAILPAVAVKSCSQSTAVCPLGHATVTDSKMALVLADADGVFRAMGTENTVKVCTTCRLIFL